MKKHLYLTGFMGAGKSRIGRMLAAELGWSFIDTDKLIEQQAGKSVKEIFERESEVAFRAMETHLLKELSNRTDPAVIALGGGALQNPENFKTTQTSGLLIYIKSAPEAILERVKHTRKRPLLMIPEGERYEERLLEKIREIMTARESHYLKADLVFDRDHMELEEIVNRLKMEIHRLGVRADAEN